MELKHILVDLINQRDIHVASLTVPIMRLIIIMMNILLLMIEFMSIRKGEILYENSFTV